MCRLLQIRAEQVAGIMEGGLAGESGPAASTITAAADSARMWNAGKGGAYWAPGARRQIKQSAHLRSLESLAGSLLCLAGCMIVPADSCC